MLSPLLASHHSTGECVAFLVKNLHGGDGCNVDQHLECELLGEDLNGNEEYKLVYVKGLTRTTSWAKQISSITSGLTTIFAPEGTAIGNQMNDELVNSYHSTSQKLLQTAIVDLKNPAFRCLLTSSLQFRTHTPINPTTVWMS